MWRCDSYHCGRTPNAKSASATKATGEPRTTPSKLLVVRHRQGSTSGILTQPIRLGSGTFVLLWKFMASVKPPIVATRPGFPPRRRLTPAARDSTRRRKPSMVLVMMGARISTGQGVFARVAARVAADRSGLKRRREATVMSALSYSWMRSCLLPSPRTTWVFPFTVIRAEWTHLAVHHRE